MYGQRGIPAMLDFCKDIREVAEPGALFLNYANPMAMNTWAGNRVRRGRHDRPLPRRAARLASRSPRRSAHRAANSTAVCSGINHQTWYIDLSHEGREIGTRRTGRRLRGAPGLLAAGEGAHRRAEALRLLLDRVATATCREYLPWYRKRPDEITKWIDMSDWIHGETGGYLRFCTESRNWFETDFPKFLEDAGKPLADYERTDEHASHIIEALETGRIYRGHFNVKNNGVITNLPRRLHHRDPRLRRSLRHQHGRRHHAAGGLRGDLHRLDQRPAHVRGGRGHRRRRPAEAGRAARSAGRRDLHARRGLADGRRDARRAGAVAAAICRCRSRRRASG